MLLERLFTESAPQSSFSFRFWFVLSLVFSTALSLLALKIAFSEDYVIQNDARQYISLLYRFKDPNLFPHDLITDYYESVAPPGFQGFYNVAARFGIDPLVLNKILPLPLALITTGFCFALCWKILPVPVSAFFASALLNENLWTREDLSSGTPRAFVYPLFTAFCYYLLKGSQASCLILIALLGLFFPPLALLSLGILLLKVWEKKLRRDDLLFFLAATALTLILVLPYAISGSVFGPVVSKSEARTIAAFLPGGNQPFFAHSRWTYWLTGPHSGWLPYGMRPPLIWICLSLPFLLRLQGPQNLPTTAKLLAQVVFVSTAMFLLAHLFLFRLYNPGRYTQHALPIVAAIAAGIALTIFLQHIWSWKKSAGVVYLIAIAMILLVQFQKTYAHGYGYQTYVIGSHPKLYEFFQHQPETVVIASLSDEADNLPAFSQRATFVGREYALPYHLGYYRPLQQRAIHLIRALYSPDPVRLKKFLRAYPIDFLLLDRAAYQRGWFAKRPWYHEFHPAYDEAVAIINSGQIPAALKSIPECSAIEDGTLVVLNAKCILQ